MKFILLICAISMMAQAITYLPHTQTLGESSTQYSAEVSYFKTLLHADPDSKLVELTEGESFNQVQSNLWFEYGFTTQLQMGAGVRFRNNSGTLLDSGETQNFSNSGTDAYMFSIRYSFPRNDGWQFAIEGNYSQTTYNNNFVNGPTDSETIVLGDDGQSVSAGASASYLFESQNFLSGRLMYRNPSRELSSEFVMQAEYALTWEKISLYAGVENVMSLRQDAYTQDPENKPQIATQSTYLYNSINRAWTAPYVGGILKLGKRWRIEYKAQDYLLGTSTDLGIRHIVTLYRRTGGVDMFKQLNQTFKEYTIEASVSKLSKGKSSAILNAGMAAGLKEGMKVDFYFFDYLGGNELIASGYVIKSGADKSMVKITRRFSKRKVQEGTVARSGLISQ